MGDVMATAGPERLRWRCSSFCNGGDCVEVAVQADRVAIRNSADIGNFLTISLAGWRAFIRDCKDGLHS
jgi:Domain of unknown function (DUF397)